MLARYELECLERTPIRLASEFLHLLSTLSHTTTLLQSSEMLGLSFFDWAARALFALPS